MGKARFRGAKSQVITAGANSPHEALFVVRGSLRVTASPRSPRQSSWVESAG